VTKTNWTRTRDQLWQRSHGLCEVSGLPLDLETFHAHHRRNKGMGGTDREDKDWLSNMLALDPDVHNGGPRSVHGRRAWSEPRGYLVPKNVEWASMVPVLYRGRFWLMLGDTLAGGGLYPVPGGIAPVLG
jgi:5-methylcytosine-specific restriction endonuclease McrA